MLCRIADPERIDFACLSYIPDKRTIIKPIFKNYRPAVSPAHDMICSSGVPYSFWSTHKFARSLRSGFRIISLL